MNTRIKTAQLNILLQKMQLQAQRLNNSNEKIPQIELDVMLRHTRELYELLLEIDRDNLFSSDINAHRTELPEAEPAIPMVSVRDEAADHKESQPETGQSIVSEPSHHKSSNESAGVVKRKSVERSASLFDEIPVGVEQKESLYDKLKKSSPEKSLADKLSVSRLADLKKSIGINEKFKFVNDLFEGNLQEYNSCIDAINNESRFEDAEAYLNKLLGSKYHWDKESEVYVSFISLVQRKFN